MAVFSEELCDQKINFNKYKKGNENYNVKEIMAMPISVGAVEVK